MESMKLKILGQNYSVNFVSRELVGKVADKHEEGDLLGLSNSDYNVINIRKGLCEEKKEEILLHEVIHAVSAQMSINLNERQTACLAVGLYAIFKENRMSFKWPFGTKARKR